MAKANERWTVHDHGPIEKLAENLWRVDGSLPKMSLRRNMVLARLADGRLVVHNAIALAEPAMKEIEAWGSPAFLIVPNAFHRLDAPAFKRRYPNVRVLTPRGARQKVAEVIGVDGAYEDFPSDDTVRFQTLAGMKETEGAMIVRSNDGTTVVLNDAVFNMDRKTDPLGFIFSTLMGSAPGPRVSRLIKLVLIKEPKALRGDLEAFAAIPDLVRVLVAHEKVAHGPDAAATLRMAAATL